MGRKIYAIFVSMLVATFVLPWGESQAQTRSTANQGATMGSLRQKAARVQERRKARITHTQREAAAERAKAKGTVSVTNKTIPGSSAADKGGKGAVK